MPLRVPAAAAAALLLSACQAISLFGPRAEDIEVAEVYGQTHCGTQGAETRLRLLPDRQAVAALPFPIEPSKLLAPGPYVLVEMGERPSGGYRVAVSRRAEKFGDRIRLHATFIRPPENAMATLALTSPCVLVALPEPASKVELVDQTGTVRAVASR